MSPSSNTGRLDTASCRRSVQELMHLFPKPPTLSRLVSWKWCVYDKRKSLGRQKPPYVPHSRGRERGMIQSSALAVQKQHAYGVCSLLRRQSFCRIDPFRCSPRSIIFALCLKVRGAHSELFCSPRLQVFFAGDIACIAGIKSLLHGHLCQDDLVALTPTERKHRIGTCYSVLNGFIKPSLAAMLCHWRPCMWPFCGSSRCCKSETLLCARNEPGTRTENETGLLMNWRTLGERSATCVLLDHKEDRQTQVWYFSNYVTLLPRSSHRSGAEAADGLHRRSVALPRRRDRSKTVRRSSRVGVAPLGCGLGVSHGWKPSVPIAAVCAHVRHRH